MVGLACAAILAGCMVPSVPKVDLEAWGLPAIVVPEEERLHWPTLPTDGTARISTKGVSGAVIVSLERYGYGDGRNRAHEVASAWYEWLRREANVPAFNIEWLRDEQATRKAFERALLAVGANSERPGEVVVLFIGHGFTDDKLQRERLLLYDSVPTKETAPGTTQQHFLEFMRMQERVRVLVVWDACKPPGLNLRPHQRSGIKPRSATPVELSRDELALFDGLPLGEGPSLTKHRPRITVLTAGVGDACLERLPGDDRPALAYWALAGLLGWASEGGTVEGGRLGEFAQAWSQAIVAERYAAADLLDPDSSLPRAAFVAVRRLWHTREAFEPAPAVATLLPPEKAAMLTESGWAGGALVAPPPVPHWLSDPLPEPALPPDVAAAVCRTAERGQLDAEREEHEWQCTRWKAYARRWQRFLPILDVDHRAVTDMLTVAGRRNARKRSEIQGRVADFLLTYHAFAEHPKVRAVATAQGLSASPREAWMTARHGDAVEVTKGSFLRGCADDDRDCEPDELPSRQIWLKGFRIDRNEVSNLEYRFCELAGACKPRDFARCYVTSEDGWTLGMRLPPSFAAPDRPAVCVSWDDAQRYCTWRGGALPTEAQWEKAARGTDARTYPWTSDRSTSVTCEQAHHAECGDDPVAVTEPLGGASPYGVRHMAGNVAEWVADYYATGYNPAARTNPTGPRRGELRSVRGGSFADPPQFLRTSYRFGLSPGFGYAFVGFRCAGDR